MNKRETQTSQQATRSGSSKASKTASSKGKAKVPPKADVEPRAGASAANNVGRRYADTSLKVGRANGGYKTKG